MTDLNLTHCFLCSERSDILRSCHSCGGFYCPNCFPISWHFCHAVDWETLDLVAGAIQ
jgi:hypothetical protein